jgi:hypothetical protein
MALLNWAFKFWLRQVPVDLGDHGLRRMGTGYGQDLWMNLLDPVCTVLGGLRTETSRDNHPTIFGERFTDRVEAFAHGVIDKTAGIHDHEIGIPVVWCDLVTVRTQLRQDQFTIDKRFGAPKRDKSNAWHLRH